jgi:hypothetical protein
MTALQGCCLPARRLQHSQDVEVNVALMQCVYSSAEPCQSVSQVDRGCMRSSAA